MADLRPVYVAGDGDVKGPVSSSNNFLPLFADTTGKLLKSSGTGVTTQGLAILDDNTPAEQRNTIGLDQINNTSDINKPVSAAQQAALNLKQDKLQYTPVQQGGGSGQSDNKVYIGWSNANKLTVYVDAITLGNVAFNLDSVNNTSDIDKPVSTAQQAALNLKQDKLLYTPVQQGGGSGQSDNKVYIGWGNGRLTAAVDAITLGNVVFDGNTATESVVGVAKVATQALTNAGVDDTTIVTPKKLRFGFQFIVGTNGAIILPSWLGGFILQWGSLVLTDGSSSQVTFPVQFVTSRLATWSSVNINIASWAGTVPGTSTSDGTNNLANMVVAYNDNGGRTGIPVSWFALGK